MDNKNIIAALVKAQLEISPPVKSGTNPLFRSKYATLDDILSAVRDPLARNGLVLTNTIHCNEGAFSVTVRLYHTSGEFLESSFPMFVEKQNNQGPSVCQNVRFSLLSVQSFSPSL